MPAPAGKEPADAAPRRGRGRPSGRSGGDTRAAILAAAQRLFGEAGYDGVSMAALAAECGVNPRALYYHFPSKRALFESATAEAFGRFGEEVVARVFCHERLRDRVQGYVDVFRALHAEDPRLLSFIGVVLVDTLAASVPAAGRRGDEPPPTDQAAALRMFLEGLVDDAIARGEVHPDLDRAGALLLLDSIGMGLALASIHDSDAFPAMLDALDLLTEGTLFVDPA